MMIQAPSLSSWKGAFLVTSNIQKNSLRVACALAFLGLIYSAESVLADEPNASEQLRFEVSGERLLFNGRVERDNGHDRIAYADARELRQILRDNPEIKLVELESDGGVPGAALEMAATVVDFGLDTVVTERCESACTLVFLAGGNRTLAQGGRLGFHSGSWSRDSMIEYYEETRESSGWIDEFAFASWAYEEGIRDFNKKLEFLVSRGVDVQFTIRVAYVNFSDIWHPTRTELLNFGIIHPE